MNKGKIIAQLRYQIIFLALIVLIGVALGQVADGDPKIINLIRRFFASNS